MTEVDEERAKDKFLRFFRKLALMQVMLEKMYSTIHLIKFN